jgi:hypothetical protein
MNELKVPGAAYSFLLAVGGFAAGWIVDYFTSGEGAALIIAPAIVAIVPIILKMFTVQAPPAALSRGIEPTAQPSKMRKFILGG